MGETSVLLITLWHHTDLLASWSTSGSMVSVRLQTAV